MHITRQDLTYNGKPGKARLMTITIEFGTPRPGHIDSLAEMEDAISDITASYSASTGCLTIELPSSGHRLADLSSARSVYGRVGQFLEYDRNSPLHAPVSPADLDFADAKMSLG